MGNATGERDALPVQRQLLGRPVGQAVLAHPRDRCAVRDVGPGGKKRHVSVWLGRVPVFENRVGHDGRDRGPVKDEGETDLGGLGVER